MKSAAGAVSKRAITREIRWAWSPEDTLDMVLGYRPPKRSEPIRVPEAPGRNDPCSCGSGQKFKPCCAA